MLLAHNLLSLSFIRHTINYNRVEMMDLHQQIKADQLQPQDKDLINPIPNQLDPNQVKEI